MDWTAWDSLNNELNVKFMIFNKVSEYFCCSIKSLNGTSWLKILTSKAFYSNYSIYLKDKN